MLSSTKEEPGNRVNTREGGESKQKEESLEKQADLQSELERQLGLKNYIPLPSTFSLFMAITSLETKKAVNKTLRLLGMQKLDDVDLESIRPPNTEAVKRATEIGKQIYDEWLFNHCMRSYYYGMAIAKFDCNLNELDTEAAYVATIFHDMAFTREGKKSLVGPESFEVRGAKHCLHCATRDLGFDNERAKLMYEAIRLHTSITNSRNPNATEKFITYGAGADVLALRYQDIHPSTHGRILHDFPRMNFKKRMNTELEEEFARCHDPHFKSLIVDIDLKAKISGHPHFGE